MCYRVKFDTSSVVGTASGAASPVLLDAINESWSGTMEGFLYTASPILLDVLSAIPYGSLLDVALKGCIGAAAGFLTTLLIKKALKAMKIKID